MHSNVELLTALAVFFHMGTSIAAQMLKDRTDQAKIAALNGKVDQVLGVVSALVPALPAALPKTLPAAISDVAAVAEALTKAP